MPDLRELDQEVILEHSKAPRNYREMETANHRAEAARLVDQFHRLVTGQSPANGNRAELGKLAVFSGVSDFPVRVKCATLAWHALHAAMRGKQETVSTE